MMRAFCVLAAVALTCTWAFDASAARLEPASTEASSSYPPEDGVRYGPRQGVDNKLATSWVEGDEGSGLGSWLKLELGSTQKVTGIKMWAGMWYSYDFWTRANRPKQIEVKFSDGTTEMFELKDEMVAQTLTFAKPHDTSMLRIRVKGVFRGTTWFDTAISEVQVFNDAPEANAKVSSYASSSQLPDDADGNYNPDNLADGIADSMWCEGAKDGDGSNEWLEFNFAGQQEISKITLINGIGGSMSTWVKGNRAKTATLTFADGSTEQLTLKNSFTPQTLSFPSRSTAKVRLTFNEVVTGKEYNDLCISEAYFAP